MAKLSAQLSMDSEGGCLYVQFSNERIAKTLEYTDFINIDLSKKGKFVGIEFITKSLATGDAEAGRPIKPERTAVTRGCYGAAAAAGPVAAVADDLKKARND